MQHTKQLKSAHIPHTDTLLDSSYDYTSYFKNIQSYLNKSDLSIANMEFAVGASPFTGYPSFSAPTSLLEEAHRSGIDIFLCANNHICDKGRRGLKSSINSYRELGLIYTGVYEGQEDYLKNNPLIIKKNNISVAFINFTYGLNGYTSAPSPYFVPMMNLEEISQSVQRAKDANVDLIIALPHWGKEYATESNKHQQYWQEKLYSLGVDIVIGTHPHVVQEIDVDYENGNIDRLTAYSLGNYISNMSKKFTRIGLALEISVIRNPQGKIQITDYNPIWTWCALAGRIEENYTSFPIEKFLNKGLINNPAELTRIRTQYEELLKILPASTSTSASEAATAETAAKATSTEAT